VATAEGEGEGEAAPGIGFLVAEGLGAGGLVGFTTGAEVAEGLGVTTGIGS
jgi:hypothetical protein